MQIKHHMSINIDGLLRNFKRRKITIFDDDNGNRVSDKEARQYLAECKLKGWKLIPMGEVCEGYDYFKNGCPGHEVKE